MNTAIYEHSPEIPQKLHESGDEILGHGLTNSEAQGDLDEKTKAELNRTATETIQRHEGQRPAGWLNPWLANSEVTADLPQEAGFPYFMNWTCDDQPNWMKTRNSRILARPYPTETNDKMIIWASCGSATPQASSPTCSSITLTRCSTNRYGSRSCVRSPDIPSCRDGTDLPRS